MSENIYYYPEKHGLRTVTEYNDPSAHDDYGFSIFVAWQSKLTGKIYFASDSGCSCPAPFEDYQDIHDLEEVANPDDLQHSLRGIPPSDARDFIHEVKQAIAAFSEGSGR